MKGRLTVFKIDATGGSPAALGGCNSASLSRSTEKPEVTDFDSGGDREYVPVLRDQTISASGFVLDAASNAKYETLEDSWEASTLLEFELEQEDGKKKSGTCFVDSLSEAAEVAGVMTYNVTFQVTGGTTTTAA